MPRMTCSPYGPIRALRVACDIDLFPPNEGSHTGATSRRCGLPYIKSLGLAEHFGARARNGRVRAVGAGARRPSALFDERALLIRAHFLQLGHVGCGFGAALKLVDADRRERRDNRGRGAALDRGFRGPAGGPPAPPFPRPPRPPAAPVEPDDQSRDRAAGRALQKALERVPAKNCWHFHDVFPFARRVSERVQRMPEMGSGRCRRVGLKGRPLCAGVSVTRTMRVLWRKVDGGEEIYVRILTLFFAVSNPC